MSPDASNLLDVGLRLGLDWKLDRRHPEFSSGCEYQPERRGQAAPAGSGGGIQLDRSIEWQVLHRESGKAVGKCTDNIRRATSACHHPIGQPFDGAQ